MDGFNCFQTKSLCLNNASVEHTRSKIDETNTEGDDKAFYNLLKSLVYATITTLEENNTALNSLYDTIDKNEVLYKTNQNCKTDLYILYQKMFKLYNSLKNMMRRVDRSFF